MCCVWCCRTWTVSGNGPSVVAEEKKCYVHESINKYVKKYSQPDEAEKTGRKQLACMQHADYIINEYYFIIQHCL